MLQLKADVVLSAESASGVKRYSNNRRANLPRIV
jgi:hypothetical protein